MNKIKAGIFIPLPAAPIAVIGTLVDGKPNYTTIAFVSGLNVEPPIIGISLNSRHYSAKGIRDHGCFSLNFPSSEQMTETDCCGLVSGRNKDKASLFTTFYGDLEKAPMIQEFPISCECMFTGQMIPFAADTLYAAEVRQVYIKPEIAGPGETIDMDSFTALCFSSLGNTYHPLGKSIGKAWDVGKQTAKKIKR